MNLRPEYITLSGKRVRVWTGGTGPALLLLHSAYGDAELSWASVWNDLGENFTVITPDLPGFGASEMPSQPTLAATARMLKELLDFLKVDGAILVGNSFGVSVALEFASAFPELTHHVVVVNGGYLPLLPAAMKKVISLPFVENRFRTLMRNFSYSDMAFSKAFPNPEKLPPIFFDGSDRTKRIRRASSSISS